LKRRAFLSNTLAIAAGAPLLPAALASTPTPTRLYHLVAVSRQPNHDGTWRIIDLFTTDRSRLASFQIDLHDYAITWFSTHRDQGQPAWSLATYNSPWNPGPAKKILDLP
jgi:hypothetical protein